MNKLTYPRRRNYGVLTDISKGINQTLGDRTGRTVSMRTAHGVQNVFGIQNENLAEDLAHAGMVGALALLLSKNGNSKVGGILLLLLLFTCYHSGKSEPRKMRTIYL